MWGAQTGSPKGWSNGSLSSMKPMIFGFMELLGISPAFSRYGFSPPWRIFHERWSRRA